jgi:DNA-binding FadR family transcriptional regulator
VLREQVKALIADRIENGTYTAGERLVETRIAEELGTSQAPVREALRELELLRYVESAPFRGAWVRKPDALEASADARGLRLTRERRSDRSRRTAGTPRAAGRRLPSLAGRAGRQPHPARNLGSASPLP